MFEMLSISCNAGLKSLVPLLHCSVNHSQIKTILLLRDALPQFLHVLNLVLVNAVLQNPPHSTVDKVHVWTVERPQTEQNSLVSLVSADQWSLMLHVSQLHTVRK